MLIERKQYKDRIRNSIEDVHKKIVILYGAREVGKTTLLKDFYYNYQTQAQKYYISLDDSLTYTQFANAQEFIGYMQIKFGFDPHTPSLIFLNEVQFSTNILYIITEIARSHKHIKFILTATRKLQITLMEKIIDKKHIDVIGIFPLSLFEFLAYKNIHTEYLSSQRFSKIIYKEIQPLIDEYLQRGGYPTVVTCKTAEEKQQQLKHIVQKVYDKDAGYTFDSENLLSFQPLIQTLARFHGKPCVISSIAKQSNMSMYLAQKYIDFLEKHFIIYQVPYYCTDPSRELHKHKIIYFVDTGLLSYITNNFSSKITNDLYVKTCIYNELRRIIPSDARIYSYKKINGSAIDFLVHYVDHIVPVQLHKNNRKTVPKFLSSYIHTNQHISEAIVATHTESAVHHIDNTQVTITPFCLLQEIL